jgi:predicted HAD superfamily Cof-like phosphohydrolase
MTDTALTTHQAPLVTWSPEQVLRHFHTTFGHYLPTAPTMQIPQALADLRQELLDGELVELRAALAEGDIAKLADALADIVFVLVGTAVTYGIPFDAVLAEVFRSNMTKTDDPAKSWSDGQRKLSKGPGYRAPDVAGALARAAHASLRARLPVIDRAERTARIRAAVTDCVTCDRPDADKIAAIVTLFDAELAGLDADLGALLDRITEYEDTIGWNTVCTGCTRILNAAYAETCRAETAEGVLRAVVAELATDGRIGQTLTSGALPTNANVARRELLRRIAEIVDGDGEPASDARE